MFNDAITQLQGGIEQGLVSAADLEALQKAITAGYGYAGKPTDLTYGGVIQTESLETTLKSVTFDMKNLKFWPAVNVDKAYNLFEQYNRLTSYGNDASPYMAEGGAPQESDSTYIRDGQRICFFGKRRKVSHQMTLVRTSVGDVVAQQSKEGTMDLLKDIEREMYWGHAHFADVSGMQTGSVADLPANSIAMNGLLQQLLKGDNDSQQRSGDFEGYGAFQSIVSDMGGVVLTQDDLEQKAVAILENFGAPTELHFEPAVISAFVRQFYPQFRSAPGLANQTVGYDVNKVTTTAGALDFKPNLFLRPRGRVRGTAVNAQCPSVAGLTLAGVAAGSGGNLPAGSYHYAVTLVNDFGESAPVVTTVAVGPCVAADKVTLTITGALPAGVKYVRVYRAANSAAAATAQFVSNNKVGAAIVDGGWKMPGLGEGFLLDMGADTMKFKQLSPLSKINFAIVTTALEFAIVLYGALFVYAPRFNGVFRNCGK